MGLADACPVLDMGLVMFGFKPEKGIITVLPLLIGSFPFRLALPASAGGANRSRLCCPSKGACQAASSCEIG